MLLVTHDVNEAITLADRMIVIEEDHIGLDIAVDIGRPRKRGMPRLASLENTVFDRIFPRDKRGSGDIVRASSGG